MGDRVAESVLGSLEGMGGLLPWGNGLEEVEEVQFSVVMRKV